MCGISRNTYGHFQSNCKQTYSQIQVSPFHVVQYSSWSSNKNVNPFLHGRLLENKSVCYIIVMNRFGIQLEGYY